MSEPASMKALRNAFMRQHDRHSVRESRQRQVKFGVVGAGRTIGKR